MTSNKLPFLPGYTVETDKRNRFHKPHFFEVSNGTRIDHSQQLSVNEQAALAYKNSNPLHPLSVGPTSLTSEYAATHSATSKQPEFSSTLSSSMSRLPAWVEYDRKVLRFYGYFKESVHSSPLETWRVRRCAIYCYLEDESIHITEPKIENSGIPQGVFVKRHKIPRADGQGLYGVKDLAVGQDILVYGRIFHLVDADAFTRDFYANNNLYELGVAEDYPEDPFTSKGSTNQPSSHNKLMHPHKLYMEAALGKPMLPSATQTQQFLAHDGQVLRFYAQWDDDKLYGEKKPYIIHYYLADDTIEVNEIQTPNNGRDPFPTLLKRGKLPKDWQSSRPTVARLGSTFNAQDPDNPNPVPFEQQYYTLLDLRIGNIINCYGRLLLICSLDAFTQKFYTTNFNMKEEDFQPINMSDPEDEIASLVPPPYNGYGTEEDSLGSFLFLMPKVPKTNFKKLMEYDGVHLRYLAKLSTLDVQNHSLGVGAKSNSVSRMDEQRKFVITFYVASDQLSVFEKAERNSGFLGGKFLEKTRLKNGATGEWFQYKDFQSGAKIVVNDYVFEILEADEFTTNWMQKQATNEKNNRNQTKKIEEEKTQF